MGIKKLMKIGVVSLMAMALLTGCSNTNESTTTVKTVTDEAKLKVGVVQIVEHPALDSARDGFVEALNEAGFEGKIDYIFQNAQGDMATAQIIAQGFVDDDVDMIYAIATPTAQAAYNATKEIPILVSAVTDPVAAGLVNTMDAPGTNVTGTSDMAPIDKQLELLADLGIETDTIGFIYNTSEKNSEIQLASLKEEADKLGIKVEIMGITSLTELEQGLDVLLDKVDVLYTPTDNMVASGIHLVANKAMTKKVPMLGAEVEHVKAGGLATCGIDYYELGKQTGHLAKRILDGEDIQSLAVEKANMPEITINKTTADTLGITISEELSEKSTIIEVE